ncbi:alpha/beta hydrolase fold-domain-containing protein [Sparassis latifolia]
MSQYRHLSTVDPEFAVIANQFPRDALEHDVVALREKQRQSNSILQEYLKPRLPRESELRVIDHKVPVENGEITVRSLVPSATAEGKTFPLLVWFHGGGFILGDLDMDDYRLRILCVELQLSIVNVEYRLAPEHRYPVSWNDSYSATKWAVDNALLLSASLDKGFIVAGLSAGANISGYIAHRARDDPFFSKTPLTGHVMQVPPVLNPEAPEVEKYGAELLSMEQNKDGPVLTREGIFNFTRITGIPKDDRIFSVLLQPSHAGIPPLYVQINGLDPLRDEGLLYAKLVEEAGVKTRVDM